MRAAVMTTALFMTLASAWLSGVDIASSTVRPVYWLTKEQRPLSVKPPTTERNLVLVSSMRHDSIANANGSKSTHA